MHLNETALGLAGMDLGALLKRMGRRDVWLFATATPFSVLTVMAVTGALVGAIGADTASLIVTVLGMAAAAIVGAVMSYGLAILIKAADDGRAMGFAETVNAAVSDLPRAVGIPIATVGGLLAVFVAEALALLLGRIPGVGEILTGALLIPAVLFNAVFLMAWLTCFSLTPAVALEKGWGAMRSVFSVVRAFLAQPIGLGSLYLLSAAGTALLAALLGIVLSFGWAFTSATFAIGATPQKLAAVMASPAVILGSAVANGLLGMLGGGGYFATGWSYKITGFVVVLSWAFLFSALAAFPLMMFAQIARRLTVSQGWLFEKYGAEANSSARPFAPAQAYQPRPAEAAPATPDAPTAAHAVRCNQCGAEQAGHKKFCFACGTQLT